MALVAGIRRAREGGARAWRGGQRLPRQRRSPCDYVELALVAAFYSMVGRMLDAMGVPLEPEVAGYQPRL
jgi:hypothetical protein